MRVLNETLIVEKAEGERGTQGWGLAGRVDVVGARNQPKPWAGPGDARNGVIRKSRYPLEAGS